MANVDRRLDRLEQATTTAKGPSLVECDGSEYGLPPTEGGWVVATDEAGGVLKAWPSSLWRAR